MLKRIDFSFRKMKKEKRRSSLGRGRISIGRSDLNASAVEGISV